MSFQITKFEFVRVSARRRRRSGSDVAQADYEAEVEAPADEDPVDTFNGELFN